MLLVQYDGGFSHHSVAKANRFTASSFRDLNFGTGGLVVDALRAHGVFSDPLAALDAEVGLLNDLCIGRARFVVRLLNNASAHSEQLLNVCLG